MSHRSAYSKATVIVQEPYRPTSTYSNYPSNTSSASRSSAGSTNYYTSTMDSSSSSSRSSLESGGSYSTDHTGTYRNSSATGHAVNVSHNTKGPYETVLIQHNTKSNYDPAEPRSSDAYTPRR